MKKIFGGINLNWTKLVIFATLTGIYTVIMTMIPAAKET